MKKFITIIFVLLSVVAVAQVSRKTTLASAATVTTTTYYAIPVSNCPSWTMQWSIAKDAIVKTDSVLLHFEGSIDNTTWYKTSLPGTPVTTAGTNSTFTFSSSIASLAVAATNTASTYAGGSAFYTPSFYLTPPYFRAVVTPISGSTVTVTGYLYTKE